MPRLVEQAAVVKAVGNKPKVIEEHAGRVEHEGGSIDVRAGQAVIVRPGEWIRYSSPDPEGAEYVAVCLPAFSPATVHRDGEDLG